jgi:hypothetical protein
MPYVTRPLSEHYLAIERDDALATNAALDT